MKSYRYSLFVVKRRVLGLFPTVVEGFQDKESADVLALRIGGYVTVEHYR